ncbi:MAG: glycosyltransferase family 2 protein [Rhizobiaceae bacterium]
MISIVIPAKNEAANLPALLDEIETAMAGHEFEVIVVDDGSTDGTGEMLTTERRKRKWQLRQIRHDRSSGKSLALRTGFIAARGKIVATLDADGQNDPKYVNALIDALQGAGPAVVLAAGRRLGRKHSALKNLASSIANSIRAALLGDSTPDSACGLKAGHTDVLRRLPYFEGAHRFLPALVKQEGFDTVHVEVVDRPRMHGSSHYGIWDRGIRGLFDLIGVAWLQRRRKHMPIAEEITDD